MPLKRRIGLPNTSRTHHRIRGNTDTAPEIKTALCEETGSKCIYCESKIGHNTPGDVEHKIPSSKAPTLHFDWGNLTIACSECNRRKNNYYERDAAFLDPYADPVEEILLHLGPLVYWRPGDERAEVTVRTLELDTMARSQLFQKKLDILEKARSLAELVIRSSGALRALREDELRRMQDVDSEYSATVRSYIKTGANPTLIPAPNSG